LFFVDKMNTTPNRSHKYFTQRRTAPPRVWSCIESSIHNESLSLYLHNRT
jgi:hypothetical protein